jgi:hypothetical protein
MQTQVYVTKPSHLKFKELHNNSKSKAKKQKKTRTINYIKLNTKLTINISTFKLSKK